MTVTDTRNRILALLLTAVLLAAGLGVRAAAEAPDPDRTGSIRITLRDGENPITDGTLTAYHAAELVLQDGVWQYGLTGEFEGCGADLKNLRNPDLPRVLAACAERRHIQGISAKPDKTGTTVFEDLELGVYLIVQTEPARGYLQISDFLVTVPAEKDGAWIYEVDASPKTEIVPETEPTRPTEPTLPQTGQLNWPVPVMALGGILLFGAGWLLYYKKDGDEHEA